MYYIYIIYSQKLQRYYAGSTQDVERRVLEHNTGKSRFTRPGIPWNLVYTEVLATRSEAVLRERQIKGRGIRRYLEGVQSVPPA